MPENEPSRLPWEWRKAWGGWTHDDLAACDPMLGIAASCEPVNEGSHLCPKCMEIVRRQPQRRKREVAS